MKPKKVNHKASMLLSIEAQQWPVSKENGWEKILSVLKSRNEGEELIMYNHTTYHII